MTPSPAPQHPDTPDRTHRQPQRTPEDARSIEDRQHFKMIRAATERRTITGYTAAGQQLTGTLVWWPHPDRLCRGTRARIELTGGRRARIVADVDQVTLIDDTTEVAVS